jgi:hypothetical protein
MCQEHLVDAQMMMDDRVSKSIRKVWWRVLAFITDDLYNKYPESTSSQHFKEPRKLFQISDIQQLRSSQRCSAKVLDKGLDFEA